MHRKQEARFRESSRSRTGSHGGVAAAAQVPDLVDPVTRREHLMKLEIKTCVMPVAAVAAAADVEEALLVTVVSGS